MIGARVSLLSAALLLGKACEAISSSCSEHNAVSNPSFEDGLTDWTVTGEPTVAVDGDAPDGTHYLEQTGEGDIILLINQQLEGLDTSATYTASFTWRPRFTIVESVYSGICDVGLYHDEASPQNAIIQTTQPMNPSLMGQWHTVTTSWTPTSSNPTLVFYGWCAPVGTYQELEVGVDNIELTTEVCCTTTSTPTPSPSSVSVSSRIPVSISSSRPALSLSSKPIIFSSSSVKIPAVSLGQSSGLPLSSFPASSPVRTPARTSPTLSFTGFPTASLAIPTRSASRQPPPSSRALSPSLPSPSGSPSGSPAKTSTGGISALPVSSSAVILPSSVDPSGRNPSASGSSGSSTLLNTVHISKSTAAASASQESTTSTIFSTRTATITACPTTVPNCPARDKTTYVTTETIAVSTTVCPLTETRGASITGQPEASSNVDTTRFTTSTVLSTRTATITACPSTVTNCPAKAKGTYVTTETVVVSTTVCPVTETGAASVTGQPATPNQASGKPELVTSTIFSTRTATITACPSTVPNCPASAKSTYVTTETLVAATTVQTVTEGNQAIATGNPTISSVGATSATSGESVTSTVHSTMVFTVVGCTNGQSKCPDSAKSKQTSTTLVPVSTIVLPASGVSETSSLVSIATSAISPSTQTLGLPSLPANMSNPSSNGSFVSFAPIRTATFGSASGFQTSAPFPAHPETSASGPSAPVFTGAASHKTWALTNVVLSVICVIFMAI